ncbi:hypothetical protein GlitD10_1345 [Gloeomargarita lithophora Alchichica-D10]|uniref:Uncharacterized protein n=1 Tax=Gloeomargarita lithophora Alchichica-D10 TaxID=1188229 RepID=A0A1J0ACK6_9CYAN|nr:hypothetical protein [Gloeomargarita lithophora]APB33666.1 hypothetical protein GlitD10_1345 [Gloeomargarita lithophora Alchichica-D10]
MPIPCQRYLATVLAPLETPCISVYLPTHRSHPDNLQDPIRFKNLVKQVDESLAQSYSGRERQPWLEPWERLQNDEEFWHLTLDGLAVLASPSRFDVFTLPRSVPERVVVADSFHLKPLLRYSQSADRYHVLAVAEDKYALFEGNRYALDPIPEPSLTGSVRTPAGSDPRAEVVTGEGMAAYFREVDRVVTAAVSQPSELPMLLAALPENVTPFRSGAKNPHLLPETLVGDPFALDTETLRQRSWAVMESYYLARLAQLREHFGTALAREQGTGDLAEAARAAVAGRIGTLLIDSDQVMPGRIDPTTGAIQAADLSDPTIDDQLDDLAEWVLKMGGDVVVVPGERMPTTSGLAAIYRY